jgi:hypothetical protein
MVLQMPFPFPRFCFSRCRGAATAGAILLAAALACPSAVHAESGAFTGFAGSWAGGGTITIADSGTERIRCRGTNTVEANGNALRQVLRCASDSYKFELTSNVTASGGNVSGSWNEATRNVNGTVEGTIANGQVSALVTANGYAATFSMTSRGNRQTVNISSKGEVRGVNVSLSRGS